MAKPNFSRFLARTAQSVYRYHYYIGAKKIRRQHRFNRWFGRVTAPLRRMLRYHWTRRIKWPVHRFFRKQRLLRHRIGDAFALLWRRFREKPVSVFPTFGRLCRGAVQHYWDELSDLARLLSPVAAGAVLAVTVAVWAGTPYNLSVTYRDNDLGVINSAAVYDSGAAMALDRVINADNSFTVDKVPDYSVVAFSPSEPMNEKQMCDAILSTAGDAIGTATGLYVDGKFVGAMAEGESIQQVLDELQAKYIKKPKKNQRVEFVQEVEQVEGLYPTTAVVEGAALEDELTTATVKEVTYQVESGDTLSEIAAQHEMSTSELLAMNTDLSDPDALQVGEKLVITQPQARLQVKVVETKKRMESINYRTKTIYRDDKPTTWSKVITKGKKGKQLVVEEITKVSIGDKLVQQGKAKVVERTTKKAPITQVREVGTKRVYNSQGQVIVQGDGLYVSNWAWPVPVCHRVYQGYHRGHLAIDISSGPIPVLGKPCVAANGGKVVYAGWYYGYGYYIKIDHGNGLYTTYAHLQSIGVRNGQQVSRGQQIGKVGSSGYSTGPHLHFEVIRNGVRVNPLNYVRP